MKIDLGEESPNFEPSKLIFIESSIYNNHDLGLGIDNTELVLLDSNYNGIKQITEALAGYENLDSIQIISHGDNAQIQLGDSLLNSQYLDSYRQEIQSWGKALSQEGDLLFYGCQVTAEQTGINFIEKIAQLTSADVAASNNITGIDGDWILEHRTGSIESDLVFNIDSDINLAIKQVTGTPTPYQEILLRNDSILSETNENWNFEIEDYNGDGIKDIFAINQQGDSSTEITILNGADNYQSYLLQTATALDKTGDSWHFEVGDYNNDGKIDIYAINQPGSEGTAVYLLDGATQYNNQLLLGQTSWGQNGQKWDFGLADYNNDNYVDLFAIDRKGAENTPVVRIFDGANRYETMLLKQVITGLNTTDYHNWEFELEDYDGDDQIDIFAINKQGSSKTEVNILNGNNQYHEFLLQANTKLWKTNHHWDFEVADYDGDGKIDLFGINRQKFSTHTTEVRILKHDTQRYYWSDSGIWGGQLPNKDDEILIDSDTKVILDTNTQIKNLQIDGTLIVGKRQSLALTTDWLMVNNGRFQVGTEKNPYAGDFTLTLEGDNPDLDIERLGIRNNNAFLMVRGNNAVVEMHGISREKKSWTQLGTTAEVGSTQITLKESVNWKVEDQIVLASTDFDFEQAEELTIIDISNDGKTLTLDKPLEYKHFGELQTYSNGQKTWTLDQRAEVGLLSRNIKIQGDEDSVIDGFGGHMMVMMGAEAYIEGVEFTRMGQKGILGRYPFHWHMRGDAAGQYITNSSIHHTYNRAVTVHGTHNTLVKNNVAYENLGHAYFLEDGIETGNIFDGNLGLSTRRPSPEDSILDSDLPTDRVFLNGSSTFWISNPDNAFINNRAAGSEGSSYWFSFTEHPTGLSATDEVWPRRTPLKEFRNNTSHSSKIGLNIDFFRIEGPVDGQWIPRQDPSDLDSSLVIPEFTNFTGYKHLDFGIWSRGGPISKIFTNSILADNGRGASMSRRDVLKNSLLVGGSDNYSYIQPKGGKVAGLTFYLGSSKVINSHFADFDKQDNMRFLYLPDKKSQFVYELTGVTGDGSAPLTVFDKDHHLGAVFADHDGSLTGRPGSSLVANHPMMIDGDMNFSTDYIPEINGWITENRYGQIELIDGRDQETKITRVDDGASYTRTAGSNGKMGVILGKNYTYRYEFLNGVPDLTSFRFGPNSGQMGDTLYIEVPDVPTNSSVYYQGQKLNPLANREALRISNSVAYSMQDGKLLIKMKIDRLNIYGEPTSGKLTLLT